MQWVGVTSADGDMVRIAVGRAPVGLGGEQTTSQSTGIS